MAKARSRCILFGSGRRRRSAGPRSRVGEPATRRDRTRRFRVACRPRRPPGHAGVTSLRAGRGGGSVFFVAFRAGLSIALLLALAWWLDAAQILARLSQMRSEWVLLALALSVVQVFVSAWRWRFTAGRLGIDLRFGEAVREYYLSMFVNQVLPGGVVGDVSRAWRHAAAPAVRGGLPRRAAGRGSAARRRVARAPPRRTCPSP